MTSRWWTAVGAAALTVAVGVLTVGCGPDKKDGGGLPPYQPPVFPSYSPRPPSPTPVLTQGGCGGMTPLTVPVLTGWEATYTMCGNLKGTQAIVTNISTGVLHVAPDRGAPLLRQCPTNPRDPVATVVNNLLPTGADTFGAVWIAPGGCATISSLGAAYVRVNLDYSRSGAIFLASSFAKYAMNRVGANRALSFLNNVGDCANNATTRWRATGSTPPPVPTVLTSAVSGYFACKSVMDTVNKAVGAGTEIKAETSGLLAAAEEIGAGLWEDVLKLAISDAHLLSLLPK